MKAYEASKKSWTKWLAVSLLPLLLLALYFYVRPFNTSLTKLKASLSALSPAQRINIRLASQALNGGILRPGEEFSFNDTVGPRLLERGYELAPSYIGQETAKSPGGGICLVSSLLYQAALSSGLVITERVPHSQPMNTVVPGLDATVAWNRADLRFRNNLNEPLQIRAHSDSSQLEIEIIGRHKQDTRLRRLLQQPTPDNLLVYVYRLNGNREELVSRNVYRLARRFAGSN